MIFAPSQKINSAQYLGAKRNLWLISAAAPLIPLLGIGLLLFTGNPLFALFALAFDFVLVPLLDAWFGEDPNNPPAEAVEALSADNWYRALLFFSIPLAWISFLTTAWAVGTLGLPLWAMVALTLGAAVMSGGMLTVGHELGHKPNRLDRIGAKFACALTGYAHFCIEHNRGHHVQVATPEDPASARLGESIYRFALREIPGTAVRGWQLERERLAKKGLSFWTFQNDLLHGYAISLAVAVLLIWQFGWVMIPFLLVHHPVGWLQLTFANYVEHYGLLRQKRQSGRYEACQPRHSWNTNHIVSNLLLFHLQRHSDHHANPLRPYQALRNFDELPRLPSGYPGSFVLAAIPPLWFRVMDPKVFEWAENNLSRINVDPQASKHYHARMPA
ncbi:MAG: alkane 1-monooxygenase [Rhizobiaceae bacterium]